MLRSSTSLTTTPAFWWPAMPIGPPRRPTWSQASIGASPLGGFRFRCSPTTQRFAIEIELDRLGIRLSHSSPYHPQTCGKVERFHQTLKKWLRRQEPSTTLRALQNKLDAFAAYYNTVRPHRAVDRHTPQEAFDARPRATPGGVGLVVPSHFRVRRDQVDKVGRVTLRYNSRLHHIGLGRRHAGTRVLMLVADLEVRILTEDGELLRYLTLDPSRNYQPQEPS